MKSLMFVTFLSLGLLFSLSLAAFGSPPAEQPANESPATATPETHNDAHESSAKNSVLKTREDKINYAIGVQLIGNFKKQGVDIDLEMVTRGMHDALAGEPLLLEEGEMRKLIMTYQEKAAINLAKARRTEAETYKQQGLSFLEENKKKRGVVTLDSGLQITKLKDGKGKKPVQSDTVECTYRGTLIDGSEFDRSKDGKPAQIKVGNMLPGVREALQLMPVGSSWKVVIPAHLGFGPRGNGSTVGPHSVLVYELELHRIL